MLRFLLAILRFFIKWIAKAKRFIDPFEVFGQLSRFSKPSEVLAPTELLRHGAVMHARGLLNSQAIQHNLDWIWPYWVNRQFDPGNESFIPRSFSLTNINLTHRNWTAVGLPDWENLAIVDPRGLVMPFHDSWSVDFWLLGADGSKEIIPSEQRYVDQKLNCNPGAEVITKFKKDGCSLSLTATVEIDGNGSNCVIKSQAKTDRGGWLVMALRPYNPEGISLISQIEIKNEGRKWRVAGEKNIFLSEKPQRMQLSGYKEGDVYYKLPGDSDKNKICCKVGMATGAALFRVPPGEETEISVSIPLEVKKSDKNNSSESASTATELWEETLENSCRLEVPDEKFVFLYKAAVRTVLLHSPGDVYPGPYTYKRFWFRDAAFILDALLATGFPDRVFRCINSFPARQKYSGYFCSQRGEWDSNGQVLWIMNRYCQFTGQSPPDSWEKSIQKGARWISRKRLSGDSDEPHAGLLPAGFSAEHLGPNDYYYWDDFWGVAGLKAAATMMRNYKKREIAEAFDNDAADFMAAIKTSLEKVQARLGNRIMPAAPTRRMDAGAIGSIVSAYPLNLISAGDEYLTSTVDYLLENEFFEGGFFQEMIHSGINPYLTLHVAQVLLQTGDERYRSVINTVADLASGTGQWPEAVHPRTKGGCMGDGQHVWAASEWLLMMRSLFVGEEGGKLIIGRGIFSDWLDEGSVSFGPIPTKFGTVTVSIKPEGKHLLINLDASWYNKRPRVLVSIPGWKQKPMPGNNLRLEEKDT